MNASDRPNTCKSRGSKSVAIPTLATGEWVSNTYATFRETGQPEREIKPDGPHGPHGLYGKREGSRVGMRPIRQLAG